MKIRTKNKTLKEYLEEIDKHYKVIDNFVNEIYKANDNEKKKFYNALNNIIELNIEIEKECNI